MWLRRPQTFQGTMSSRSPKAQRYADRITSRSRERFLRVGVGDAPWVLNRSR
jgi:hypothetical protein